MLIILIIVLVLAIFSYIMLDRRDNNIHDRLGRPRFRKHASRQELMDEMKEEYEKRQKKQKEQMEYMSKLNQSPLNRYK